MAKPKKLTRRTVLARIREHKAAIAKERDALRELLNDAHGILESVNEADEALAEAVDKLSEYL